jgi:hypothetical protein
MHTTITCIRLYPGMAISAASRISFVGLWRPGRWGLIVCIIFFLSRLARCIAYCEGFARFAGKASDAWAWVVVWLGMFCVFGKTAWDYVHWGLGVNGPNMVKHYFSAKFSAQRPSTVVRRFYLILESGCVSSVRTHQPCHFFFGGDSGSGVSVRAHLHAHRIHCATLNTSPYPTRPKVIKKHEERSRSLLSSFRSMIDDGIIVEARPSVNEIKTYYFRTYCSPI